MIREVPREDVINWISNSVCVCARVRAPLQVLLKRKGFDRIWSYVKVMRVLCYAIRTCKLVKTFGRNLQLPVTQ